jgi:hypothetical protein
VYETVFLDLEISERLVADDQSALARGDLAHYAFLGEAAADQETKKRG